MLGEEPSAKSQVPMKSQATNPNDQNGTGCVGGVRFGHFGFVVSVIIWNLVLAFGSEAQARRGAWSL
jgi:hypothetical protein